MTAGLAITVIGGLGQLIANIALGKKTNQLKSEGVAQLGSTPTLAYLGILLTVLGLVAAINTRKHTVGLGA